MDKNEVNVLTQIIVESNGGQALFNIEEAHKIVGVGRNTLPRLLHLAGVSITKIGRQKCVTAYGLATLMCSKRIAPIDNASRGLAG